MAAHNSTSARPFPSGTIRKAAGALVAMLIVGLTLAIFWNIQHTAVTGSPSVPVDMAHLVRMTALQAGLTTILSLIVGIALAWALNRLRFPGRAFVIGLFAAAIVTPGVVVALGLLQVWGRAGWINALLVPLGFDLGSSIFGLQGILAAHVILDGTFAARILLARLDAIPKIPLKTGQSLNLSPWQRFKVLDWPIMSSALPGLSAIIFLLAFTSFPIVLLLGGGPANQTMEVAIYSAVRLNFDLNGAVQLALVQLVICAAIILPAISFAPSLTSAGNAGGHEWSSGRWIKSCQIIIIALGLFGFALPLIAVLVNGLGPGLMAAITRASFWSAALTSLIVGIASASLALGLTIVLCMARSESTNRLTRTLISLPAYAYLVVPAVVMSLGFFLAIRNTGLPMHAAAPVVLIIANALLTLPFALSTLGPALDTIQRRYRRLGRSLGLPGLARWRLVEWPLLGREIGLVFALGFCFSLGDLGVISMFGTEDFATLPWLMVRAMGAYRTNDAASIAALLLLISLIAFWALPALFGKLSNAQD